MAVALKYLVAIVCCVTYGPSLGQGANILYLTFVSVRSHFITYEPLFVKLAARGHHVTILSPHKVTQEIPNITQILTMDSNEFLDKYNPQYRDLEKNSGYENPRRPADLITTACELVYDMPQVKAMLQEKFDLVLLPPMINACAAGFVYKLNTSLILLSLVHGTEWILSPIGGVLNSASTDTSFWQRLSNIWTKVNYHYYDTIFKERYAQLYREKLNDSTLPSVNEIFANASLILSNGHFSKDNPRQFFPDVIDVGALNCHPAKPLPNDLEHIVQTSGEHGFILCSFGSGLSGSSLSPAKRDVFLHVFSQLPNTILWKWEGEPPENVPPNVKLIKWLPQQDLLGHSKIKAFITQGGHLSVTEAIYHGCPIVGLPIIADQFANLEQTQSLGTAIVLDFQDLTSENLLQGINQVLSNKTYRKNAMLRSRLLKDQPMTPMNTAIYWVEYVLRHNGAKHLRSSARDLTVYELNSLDILILGFLTILFGLFIITKSTLWLCRVSLQDSTKVKSS